MIQGIRRSRERWLATAVVSVLCSCGLAAAERAAAPELKAAFLLNFAKFTDWSAVPPGAPLVLCVRDDATVGSALVELTKGQSVEGHRLQVTLLNAAGPQAPCQLLFSTGPAAGKARPGSAASTDSGVVTVSDCRDFARSGGMIELFEEAGRIRFAVNVETAEHAGVRFSSRLLGLAKIVKSDASPQGQSVPH